MNIVCLLKRAAGTQVTIGEQHYDFQPNDAGDHVCEVAEQAHIDRFLSIPEAYAEYNAQPVAEQPAPAAEPAPQAQAPAVNDEPEPEPQDEPKLNPDADYTREQLVDMYVKKFGKKPHYRAGEDKLREELGLN